MKIVGVLVQTLVRENFRPALSWASGVLWERASLGSGYVKSKPVKFTSEGE